MNLQEIRQMARKLGLDKVGTTKKVDLIHHIQRLEGNFDCFAKPQAGHCDQMGCLWRTDCLKLAAGVAAT
jgi:hypothetical protein